MWYVSTYGLMSTHRQTQKKDYIRSIFTAPVDAAFVTFELDHNDLKIRPLHSWQLSQERPDVIEAVSLSEKEILSGFGYCHSIINPDTANSDQTLISSYYQIFSDQGIVVYTQDFLIPLTGLTWLQQRERRDQMDWSQFMMQERLQDEMKRVFFRKEEPSALVMAFLQGIIYMKDQIYFA